MAGEDGLISRAEVEDGLSAAFADQQREMEFNRLNSLFNLVDTDTTGSITQEDIERARAKALDMVDAMDFDNDGAIGFGETDGLLRFFNLADKDGDGTVTIRDVRDAVNYAKDLISFFQKDGSLEVTHDDINDDLNELRGLLLQADLDSDGRMSRAELFSEVVSREESQSGDDEASDAH